VHQDYPNISRRFVAKVLQDDTTHQIHKPVNKRITSRPIIVNGPGKMWAMDLVDMQKLMGYNDMRRYILTTVDLFGKYANAVPLLNKQQTTVTKALLGILDQTPEAWQPSVIVSDRGSEFQVGMERVLASRKIKLIHSQAYNPQSNGAIERLNRTIKSQLFEHMTRMQTKRWIDLLEPIIYNINHSPHSTTRFTPEALMDKTDAETVKLVTDRMRHKIKRSTESDVKFNVNDAVRVALISEAGVRKNKFKKRIEPNWSLDIFTVYAVSAPDVLSAQPQYLLKNMRTNRKSLKKYWSYQLQHIANPVLHPQNEFQEVDEEKPHQTFHIPQIIPPRERSKRVAQPSAAFLRQFQH
jgi:transposase InsO family protein